MSNAVTYLFGNVCSGIEEFILILKKAFDTMFHQELLYKLWMFGITSPLWFCSSVICQTDRTLPILMAYALIV